LADALGLTVLEALDLEQTEKGDDGTDVTLGSGHEIDVKTREDTPTGTIPRLLIDTEKYADAEADAYVLAQTWGDENQHTVVHGWVTHRDVRRKGRIERERWRNENWEVDVDDLRSVDELRDWADGPAF
jgi:hypothetical protein